jgi:uncharacterized membrane protein YraQ (UPF0718 family)
MGRKSHMKHKAESIIPEKIKRWIRVFWDKYWEIIITIIAGIIIGKYILPIFFK